MPVTTQETDLAKDSMLGDRFLIRFSEDTLRHRPLWIRLIIEFLGTFILVTVAAGAASSTTTWHRPDQPHGRGDRPRRRW